MKLPKKVKINGVDYAVEYTKDLKDGDEILYGLFLEDKMLIQINTSNQTEVGMWRTLMHEIWHAIMFETDLKCRGYNHRKINDEEELAEMFSRSMYQIVRDNKELFECVYEGES